MRVHVMLQTLWGLEPFFTQLAGVRGHVTVHYHMIGQRKAQGEGSIAQVASVLFGAVMQLHVPIQSALIGIFAIAYFTGERALACVSSFVDSQLERSSETFIT